MGMFFNGANCDIYIGKGAGKKLLEDISNAKKSVKVISPYLSPSLINELIRLHSKGIEISLITNDNIEDYYRDSEKNIYKLIIQKSIVDENAQKLRNKWINLEEILRYSFLGLSAILVFALFLFKNPKLLFILFPILLLLIIRKTYIKKIKNKRIYNYQYSQLFLFKVYISSQNANTNSNTLIHSKIYIIDDETVFMGSLNFTYSGTKNNYETRIRTIDKIAVDKIVLEYNELFYHSGYPERNIRDWGKELYGEPIN
ncbi:phospholipase D-like domain-containing protein [Flavobacterium sp. FlaQc-48]|uniref:phospholipase D-like domain-containing protein n=1 Tax=Flavobacterium sp. FlaQc-48 TaxID=3374181 RepID=UPI003757C236